MNGELELDNPCKGVTLSQSQIELMCQALALNRNGEIIQPNKKYSPAICSNRNHFQSKHDDDWEKLVFHGFAGKDSAIGLPYYFVTPLGIYYLQNILNFKFKLNNRG